MKFINRKFTVLLLVSVALNGMEPQVKRRPGVEATTPEPTPYITFVSNDQKKVIVLRDQLAPFYGGVALAAMQEAQAPTIKPGYSYQAMSLLPLVLSAYVTAQAMKKNPKEFIIEPKTRCFNCGM